MSGPRPLPAGPYGVLFELTHADEVPGLFQAVQRLRERIGALVDVVPAERTVLVLATFDRAGRQALRDVVAATAGWAGDPGDRERAGESTVVELPVRYDGPDLAEVAELAGLAVAEVVALHGGAEFSVGFTGFAPGFAYLTGLPPELEVPRRAVPRTRVDAGAVGLAGRYSGVYPRESPGGWQIIGRLAADAPALWDAGRSAPALLQPGTRVRFRAVDGDAAAGSGGDAREVRSDAGTAVAATGPGSGSPAALRVVRPGLLTTVQDLGRPGLAHLGVPRSGAADRAALRLANRLVGNPEDAAAVETTFTGCTVELTAGRWIAVTGARALVTFAGSAEGLGQGVARYVPAGTVIDIGPALAGVRSYLAVAGGIESAAVLGSRSADGLSGLGSERALIAGSLLPIGSPATLPPDIPGLGLAPQREPADPVVLRLTPGPRDDWFTDDAWAILRTAQYTVSSASNRTGLRLDGPPLPRRDPGRELTSEGMPPGAVQVPPDGRPVLFLADHPVTGGYPVIGCVDPLDLDAAAQARPGSGVRFRVVGR